MKTRLIIFLIVLTAFSWPVHARDPVNDFTRLYYLISLEKQPLIFDLCRAFAEQLPDPESEPLQPRIFYKAGDWRGTPLWLELDADLTQDMNVIIRTGNNKGHAGHDSHQTLSSPPSHDSSKSRSNVLVIQPSPNP